MSLEIEKAVLGRLLLDNSTLYSLPVDFGAEAFTGAVYAGIFTEITRSVLAGEVVDVGLLAADRPGVQRFPLQTLKDCVGAAIAGPSMFSYCQTLIASQRARAFDLAVSEAMDRIRSGDDREAVRSGLLEKLDDVAGDSAPEFKTGRDSVMGSMSALGAMRTGKDYSVKTHIAPLDRIVRLYPGNLVVLAARPGVGKTTLAHNIAENVAMSGGYVLEHSFEMSDTELDVKTLSRLTGISTERILSEGPLSDEEEARLAGASEEAGKLPLLRNTAHDDLASIAAITRKAHRQFGLRLVVLDYLQLVRPPRRDSREQEVATIARTLKRLAERLQVPVLALSQLNREVERRTDPRPRLSDLRESGAIEQDANSVLFLHHPYLYNPQAPLQVFEVIVAKQRMGRSGVTVELEGVQERSLFRERGGA